MSQPETITDFYRNKIGHVPAGLQDGVGHFNVFKLEPYIGKSARPVPYSRRDYFKVMLVKGAGNIHYANKVIPVHRQALTFSNPQIPYKWDTTEHIRSGVFCVFNHAFFLNYGNILQYDVFQPGGTHVFELSDEHYDVISKVYSRMFAEIESDYTYKYDVLRNLMLEVVHTALKMNPSAGLPLRPVNASARISSLFLELLERQFPVDDEHRHIELRTPSDFARQLSVHVDHLNRAVKAVMQKTTSELIAERLVRESVILLRHSNWSVSEIAWALGFSETTHFNNFFKKHVLMSPLKYKNSGAP
jgi:AraC family transcriptional activator of pobA